VDTEPPLLRFPSARNLLLSWATAIHVLPSYFLKISINIIIPSTLRSSKWSLLIRSTHQNSVCIYLVTHTYHVPGLNNSSLFHSPNNIWWWVQVIKFLVMYWVMYWLFKNQIYVAYCPKFLDNKLNQILFPLHCCPVFMTFFKQFDILFGFHRTVLWLNDSMETLVMTSP
jgi:hypothetical protein